MSIAVVKEYPFRGGVRPGRRSSLLFDEEDHGSAPALSLDHEPTSPYSPEQLWAIKKEGVPKHVAIVMDGNRRWAQEKQLPIAAGHLAGAFTLTKVVEAAQALGIKTLTVYAFSTENWQRPQKEVDAVFALIEDYLLVQKDKMKAEGVCLSAIGNLESLPISLQKTLSHVHAYTASGESLSLVIALNYGGRDEICRAAQKVAEQVRMGRISSTEIDEKLFASCLDTGPVDLDLLIRSGGQIRLSNFLLWQVSYAEVYVTEVLWPDFDETCLFAAVLDYQGRKRRYGA